LYALALVSILTFNIYCIAFKPSVACVTHYDSGHTIHTKTFSSTMALCTSSHSTAHK